MTSDRANSLRLLAHLLADADRVAVADWAAVAELARQHRVAPLLFWQLRGQENGHAGVPEEVWERLRTDFFAAAARGMVAERQLAQVLGALAAAGVPTIVVKGAAVGAFYPDPALRSYSDLDLLVPGDRLDQAETALKGLGYRASDVKEWRLEHHFHLPPMICDEGGLAVEIHWRLDDDRRVGKMPVEGLWARAVPWSVGGQPALRLETVDETLYLCRHALVQHLGRMGLRPVCDLVQMMDGRSQGEWGALAQRAIAYGLARAVLLMLILAERLLGFSVPRGVMEQLRPPSSDAAEEALFEQFLALEMRSAPRMPSTVVQGWAQGTPSTRLRYLVQHLFLSREGMAMFHNVPADSPRIWLTYLQHPVVLLQRYGRSAWGVLRKDPAAQAAWDWETRLEQWLRE